MSRLAKVGLEVLGGLAVAALWPAFCLWHLTVIYPHVGLLKLAWGGITGHYQ